MKNSRFGKRPSSGQTRSVFVAGLVVLAFGLFAGTGYAAGTTPATAAGDQYKPKTVVVVKSDSTTAKGTSATAPAQTAQASGGLPFTGVSLADRGRSAIGLIGLGIMLRRRERHDES